MSRPSELTVAQILDIAKISQYLASASVSAGNNFKGSAIDERIAIMIYCERMAVQYRFDQNPNDTTLRATANYLYALLGRFGRQALVILNGLSAPALTIDGPFDQSVNVGDDAIFVATVTSTTPYTVQWYDENNNAIIGETSTTYIFPNAQLSDSGKTFYMKATNSSGTVTSVTAVLVVSAAVVGSYYYGDVDYFTELNSGVDNVPYSGTFPITSGSPLVVPFPIGAANNKFNIVKYPATQSDKAIWKNTDLNQGTIPDSVYRTIISFGGSKYIISRNAMSLDSLNTTVTYT